MLIRSKEKGLNMAKVEAVSLLTYKRFDLLAKLIYVRFLDAHINSGFGLAVYKNHLKAWNGLKELWPRKVGLDEFVKTFKPIISAMKSDAFKYAKSPVIVKNSHLFNGGHRTAAAIYYSRKIHTKPYTPKSGQFCPYSFLVKRGLTRNYANAMAVEFCRFKKSTYVALLFPSANHNKSRDVIKQYGSVIYETEINLNKNGQANLMREIYLGEPWVKKGAGVKARLCFKGKTRCVAMLVESTSQNKMVKCKSRVRAIYGLGNHSIHITDRNEASRIANTVFNNNSIHFLNHSKANSKTPKFNKYLKIFRSTFKNCDDLCIDGSAVLAAYGLRDARDIDYLHKEGAKPKVKNPVIDAHNKEAKHYPTSIDDIIFNPANFFYYKGAKFASLQMILKMKKSRNERPKDVQDVKLINNIIK